MLVRVDIRDAGVIDREVQRRRRDGAVDQMVRRARVRVARLVIGIAQRAHDVLLEPRRLLPRRGRAAHGLAPRVVLERLGGGAGPRRADAGCGGAGKQDALPEQGAAVEQPVAGNGRQRIRRRSELTLGNAHECLPRRMGVCRALFGDFLQATKVCSCPEAMSRLSQETFLRERVCGRLVAEQREHQRQHPHRDGDQRCPARKGEIGLAHRGGDRPLRIAFRRALFLGEVKPQLGAAVVLGARLPRLVDQDRASSASSGSRRPETRRAR